MLTSSKVKALQGEENSDTLSKQSESDDNLLDSANQIRPGSIH